ncbi:sodium-dependent bicarbonate transport family permease [Pseudarthrobacter phenanthrenivorans]|uniref:sodium-dependent bicarbonate transport family permease n=1 Tax=Pseudarthrobacter phenanthrenivorans TaxID=361575 RepID=UPI00217CD3C9|nr:sodium-dependent bicarbonate transport family permease [Pseudarthrobacter phenanthrenivorans]
MRTFILGALAGLLRSELRLAAAIYESVTIVLLLGIGLKGGVELAKQPFGRMASADAGRGGDGILPVPPGLPGVRYLARFPGAAAGRLTRSY